MDKTEEQIAHVNALKTYIDNTEYLSYKDDNGLHVYIDNNIGDSMLIDVLTSMYELERTLTAHGINNVLLHINTLSNTQLYKVFEFALSVEDFVDPVILLNLLNLVKIYNTLNEGFFKDDLICVNSISEFLDLKLSLKGMLEAFKMQISIYFLSLFKSYNKITYTPTDTHAPLPVLYRSLFLSTDLLTLSGIFAATPAFSTEKLVYVDDAVECIATLQNKNNIAMNLFEDILQGFIDDSGHE